MGPDGVGKTSIGGVWEEKGEQSQIVGIFTLMSRTISLSAVVVKE